MGPDTGVQRSDVIALLDEPLKPTAAVFSRADGHARHESQSHHGRLQLGGHPSNRTPELAMTLAFVRHGRSPGRSGT